MQLCANNISYRVIQAKVPASQQQCKALVAGVQWVEPFQWSLEVAADGIASLSNIVVLAQLNFSTVLNHILVQPRGV